VAKRKRRNFSKKFKAKVALEALKEHKTLGELAAEFDLHANQVSQWKKTAKDSLEDVFGTTSADERRQYEEVLSSLYEQIGRLKVELDWLKKKHDSLG
jgi:putative transposase